MEKLIFWMKKVNALFSFVGSSNAKENILLDPHFWSGMDGMNEVKRVIDAINQGANIHAYDKNRTTPLHFAAERIMTSKVLEVLLNKGANIEARDKYGQTPLYAAIGNAIEYSGFGDEFLKIASKEMVELLLDRGSNIQTCDIRKRTPLHIAAMCSERLSLVELLLDRGANCLAKDIDGKTPYDYAQKNISHAKGSICSRIYEMQNQQEPIDPEYQEELDYERKHKLANPEFWSMTSPGSHYVDRVYEAISNGADVNARGWKEMTPLLMVLEENVQPLEVISTLIDYGADVNLGDEDGRTPLHLAPGYSADFAGEEVMDCLYDADVHARDKDGMTPLHWAAKEHWYGTKIIERLLEEGADIRAHDSNDRTLLHWASMSNLPEVVKFFLDKGLDIKALTKHGRTPLHEAMCNWDSRAAVAELLLNKGANIEVRDKFGMTPLHLAAIHTQLRSSAVVTLLLNRGANIEARDEEGHTPLHWAVKRSVDTRTIDALIASGANATAQDKDGKTPFDYARENKYLKGSDAYWRLNDAHFNNEQQMVQRVAKVKRRRRIQPYLRLQKRRLGK